MAKIVEHLISKSIERVYQSWFIKEDVRLNFIRETNNYLHRIYDIIKDNKILQAAPLIVLMKEIGLDYEKVYLHGRRISYTTLEEGVYNSLEYFIASLKDNKLI